MNFIQSYFYGKDVKKYGNILPLVHSPEMLFFQQMFNQKTKDYESFVQNNTLARNSIHRAMEETVLRFYKGAKLNKTISIFEAPITKEDTEGIKIMKENDFLVFLESFSWLLGKVGFSFSIKQVALHENTKLFKKKPFDICFSNDFILEMNSLFYSSKVMSERDSFEAVDKYLESVTLTDSIDIYTNCRNRSSDLFHYFNQNSYSVNSMNFGGKKEFDKIFNVFGLIQYYKDNLKDIENEELKDKVEEIIQSYYEFNHDEKNIHEMLDKVHFSIITECLLDIQDKMINMVKRPELYKDCFPVLNKYTLKLTAFKTVGEDIQFHEFQDALISDNILLDITTKVFEMNDELKLVYGECLKYDDDARYEYYRSEEYNQKVKKEIALNTYSIF